MFCTIPNTHDKCECPPGAIGDHEKLAQKPALIAQTNPPCERKGLDGFCTIPGTHDKCECPPGAISLIEYGKCEKYEGGFGSTACIMKGTEFPTEKNVYCICPDFPKSQSLAQAEPVSEKKKDLPSCVHVPGATGCFKRGTKEYCMCPEEERSIPQFSTKKGKGACIAIEGM